MNEYQEKVDKLLKDKEIKSLKVMLMMIEEHYKDELEVIAYNDNVHYNALNMIEKVRYIDRLIEVIEDTEKLELYKRKSNKLSNKLYGKDFLELSEQEKGEVIEERIYIAETWAGDKSW